MTCTAVPYRSGWLACMGKDAKRLAHVVAQNALIIKVQRRGRTSTGMYNVHTSHPACSSCGNCSRIDCPVPSVPEGEEGQSVHVSHGGAFIGNEGTQWEGTIVLATSSKRGGQPQRLSALGRILLVIRVCGCVRRSSHMNARRALAVTAVDGLHKHSVHSPTRTAKAPCGKTAAPCAQQGPMRQRPSACCPPAVAGCQRAPGR